MVEVAPAPAPAAIKAPKKKAAQPKKAGPTVGELVLKAVSASNERSGVSLPALKKLLSSGGYDVERNNSRVKQAVRTLVSKGTLLQTKGTGASGSFKLNKAKAEPKKAVKKAAPKAKKPAAKKPAAAKKPKKAAAKKPAVKKAAGAKKATKSPKKAAKTPKAAKPKSTTAKATKPKKAAPKKK